MGSIAIIGGGTGGASAARSIRRNLGKEHKVILIEQGATIYNQALYPFLATGKRQKQDLAKEIARLTKKGIIVVNERAEKIDCQSGSIYTETGKIDFDIAVVAVGAELNHSFPPGMQEAGLDAQSLGGAEKIFSQLKGFWKEKIAILVASTRTKCPSAPYEYAFLIEDWFNRQGRAKDVDITLYTPEPSPLSHFGPRASQAVSELLLERYINIQVDSRFKKVRTDPPRIELEQGLYPFDLLIYFAEAAPRPLIRESKLPHRDGWLAVDQYLQAAGEEKIFGFGDAVEIITPSGEVLPKSGAIAHLQSFIVSGNARKRLKGEKPSHTYSGKTG